MARLCQRLATLSSVVSLQGLRPLRNGVVKRYQERLTNPVTALFGWTPDSIDRLMEGRPAAVAVDPAASSPDVDAVLRRVARLERLVIRLASQLEESTEVRTDLDELEQQIAAP